MIRNFRDLGGIKNRRGQVIPVGLLFRSANLSAALDLLIFFVTGFVAFLEIHEADTRSAIPVSLLC